MIIITKYRVENNGKFPTIDQEKIKGHNIVVLWEKAGLSKLKDLEKEVLYFIDYFAGYLRYYNIDIMMERKGKNMNDEDPLLKWKKIQEKIIQGKKIKIYKNFDELCDLLNEVSFVCHHDMYGNEVNDMGSILVEGLNRDLIQGYSVEIFYNIILKMKNKIEELQYQKYMMPVLTDFFTYYTEYLKPYQIRKKKNWLNI